MDNKQYHEEVGERGRFTSLVVGCVYHMPLSIVVTFNIANIILLPVKYSLDLFPCVLACDDSLWKLMLTFKSFQRILCLYDVSFI